MLTETKLFLGAGLIAALLENAMTTERMLEKQRRLQVRAHEWDRFGKGNNELYGALDAALVKIWLEHHGPENVDPDGVIRTFITKSLEGVNLSEVWSEQEHCSKCFETYRLENMVTCMFCDRSLCWRCQEGNVDENICICGGEMY